MKLLVTGATGFVGRNFILQTLQEKTYDQILVPVRNREKLEKQFKEDGFPELPPQILPVECAAPLWGDKPFQVDHVLHSAGILFSTDKNTYFETHVDGTVELLRKTLGAKKIIILSSQAAGGPCQPYQKEKTENDPDTPITWYGESKLEMERQVIRQFADSPVTILRPPMILGERDTATLPLFKVVRSPLRPKPGIQAKYFSYVSVSDLVSGIQKVFQSETLLQAPQRYFIAAPSPISDWQMMALASKISKKSGLTIPVPQLFIKGAGIVIDQVPVFQQAVPTLTKDRIKDIWPGRWIVSPHKFRNQFQWEAKDTAEKALSAAYQWYLERGAL